ncbi:MAG: glycosyltransferase family 2 protein, partial [Flavobacterium sp.]
MRFSVIIPTYNRAPKLRRCLDSLVSQSYKDFEVIVCDDGSTDNSKEVAAEFSTSLNIVYQHDENWGGPAKPRNKGGELAEGDYVCFLDSDDWWEPNKLLVLNSSITSAYQVYYHTMLISSDDNEHGLINCRQVDNTNPKVDLLLNLNTIPTSSVCIETSLFRAAGGFSLAKELIGLEDYDLWIRLGDFGAKFKLIKECLGIYFIGSTDNITLEDRRQIRKFDYLYRQYIDNASLFHIKNKISASLAFHTGRIIQDNNLDEPSINHYMFGLRYGSLRVRMMIVKR